MYLRDGCNALDVVDGAGGKHLLVLTVSRERLGRAISITCVHNGAYPCCKLKLDFSRYKTLRRGNHLRALQSAPKC
jgi:hypothetical protein